MTVLRSGGWAEAAHRLRFHIARRTLQAGLLLLFLGTYRWGFELAGRPLLRGNLSGSELLAAVPLADPFAVLQIVATGALPEARVLIGAAIVLLFYGLVGGRTFCSWVCPVNPVTDLAAWLRRRVGLSGGARVDRGLRYWLLGMSLALSPLIGVAAFEWLSPIGMLHRSLIYGLGLGWLVAVAILLFDLTVLRHGWCGHLCPLGAFYAVVGRTAQVRVAFDESTCTSCGECKAVCPEPQVLDLTAAAESGSIASGECSNCGACIPVCAPESLQFRLRSKIDVAGRRLTSPPAGRTL